MVGKRSIVYSVVLHVALAIIVGFSVDFKREPIVPHAPRNSIDAAVVAPQPPESTEPERMKPEDAVEQERLREVAREAAKRKTEQEAQRRAEEEAQRRAEEEAQRKAKEEARRKAEEEAQRKAEEEAQRRAEEEAQRKTEEEAQRRAEEEAQRKAEEEAQRKAEEEAQRKAEQQRAEQALQDELAAEEAAYEAAQQASSDRREIDRYVAAIARRVRQSFTILPSFEGLTCTLRITLIPGGEVAAVQIAHSSGNAAFDRQAENAVRKAAPLPVPEEPRLFQQMRSITFVFDPKI